MSDPWDEFDPSAATRSYLRWALVNGASTVGEAYELLEQFEVGNDVPEVLGHDDSVDDVRAELEDGLTTDADTAITSLL